MTSPEIQGADNRPQAGRAADEAGRHELVDGLKLGVLIGAGVLALLLPPAQFSSLANASTNASKSLVAPGVSASTSRAPRFADLRGESASRDAQFIANWVADSGDNRNLSFVIIDKKNTKVFVFDPSAKLLGATPVLLGAKVGDDSVLGIGKKKIADVLPEERTTPAGRFMGEPGRNLSGENVVWVDYDAAVSMHRVRIVDPKERRLERLASPTTDDNRISYGCVNVPIPFFENVLAPVFNKSYGVVYVLPEQRKLEEIFALAYDPAEKYGKAGMAAAGKLATR